MQLTSNERLVLALMIIGYPILILGVLLFNGPRAAYLTWRSDLVELPIALHYIVTGQEP